jgi:hypothetical protein
MMEENDGEILINLIDHEDEDFLSMEDDIEDMQRRMTAYLLGGDYKPPRGQKGNNPTLGNKRTVLTVSEWERDN